MGPDRPIVAGTDLGRDAQPQAPTGVGRKSRQGSIALDWQDFDPANRVMAAQTQTRLTPVPQVRPLAVRG
ncbi:MAG: hypothetical protein EA001_07180 [Oscillatoriales cyanobacterium]|nr:MAG: hypothetical protein EA001_07180 [Oscillatoriales cyanobacterium]